MQVSAQPRFIDHAAHSVYHRGVRHATADGGSRRGNDRSEEERRRASAVPPADRAQVSAFPIQGPEALWSLSGLESPEPAVPVAPVDRSSSSQAESLYLLLSQVVGEL